ncbi:LmbE family N-acetylglucosaminyl deacetylase [Methylobacterium brachythecii]|uniref:GlcNAc-PI de-N-acetylase n=2 Tax=Methylobacterium brachythecii TaxID=1176177 RepID=A0A7W6AMB2_9HYPH|nr:LmbE family N-acetylglucosaminyl deacetylase [Methylobacterium brachythecii]GLS46728.1 GlcNAc-PI de-N-acetylase [Methylobacterium brachythecii]
MPTALAVSPHLDDAVFSAGGTLAHLAGAGWGVTMATVFSASVRQPKGFALACQLDKGLPADADYMALRRDEDRAAASHLGIDEPVHLPFREAPHRGYGSAPELFAGLRPDDRIELNLADAFETLFRELRPDLILAPQAVGGHVDHVQVVRAIRAARPSAAVLWWRDYPYTVRHAEPQEPLRQTFAHCPGYEIRFDSTCEDRKAAACAAYTTQIGFQFGGAAQLEERLRDEGAVERFRLEGRLDVDLPPDARRP